MAGEAKLQTKILAWLKKHNFWAVKTIVCNRSGIMDVIACSPKGRFVGIEVKYGANAASELQKYNIKEVQQRGGIAFVAYDLETVVFNLKGELNE